MVRSFVIYRCCLLEEKRASVLSTDFKDAVWLVRTFFTEMATQKVVPSGHLCGDVQYESRVLYEYALKCGGLCSWLTGRLKD